MNIIKNQQGTSLVTVLMAAAIGATILSGITTMIMDVFKSQRTARARDAHREVTASIRQLLTDPSLCTASFKGNNPNGMGFTSTQIVDAATPPNIKFQTGVNYLNNLVMITGFEVRNFIADNPAAPQNGKVELNIKMNKLGSTLGSTQMVTTIFLQTILDAANKISGCYALGIADSLWQNSPSNMANIYYTGGNVGIGTMDPSAPLEVSGSLLVDASLAQGISIKAVSAFPQDPGDLIFQNNNGTERARIHSNQGPTNTLYFDVSGPGNTKMVIDQSGKVGIGTSSPAAALDVKNGKINGELNCRKVAGPSGTNGSTASCAADEYVISGGGSCETIPDINPGFLHRSEPLDDLSGWAADCYRWDWTTDNLATAFAICCKK